METTTVKLYSLDYSNVKTYWAASLFIIGNILFPQLFHLIPQGGITWLPIYFFTLLKSVLLAIAAGWTAQHFRRISVIMLIGVVFAYQVAGTLGEWIYIGNFYNAIQDFRIGIPGMCLQVFGGYLFIKYLICK